MSAVIPTHFDWPYANDGALIAPAQIIDEGDEAGKEPVERVHRLFAAGTRPSIVGQRLVTPLTQVSTSYVWGPWIKVQLGEQRAAWSLYLWGHDGDVEVNLYNASRVQVATSTVTMPAATPAEGFGSWSGVSISEGYVRYRAKAASGSAPLKLYEIKILPDVLSSLP